MLAGLRILVVEDESLVALEIEDNLLHWGAEVVGPAGDVDGALEALRTERVDGVVLDVVLRGFASTPVVEELHRRAIPFIVSTGHRAGIRVLGDIGDAPVLEKPYTREALISQAVARFTRQRAPVLA